jgi:predicted DNA-binding protein
MSTAGGDRHTNVEHRTIQGRETRVRELSDEIYIEWRPGRPVYFGVKVGDRIKDADRDVESAHIPEWEVVEITPDRVAGEHLKTGERTEWERRELEQALVLHRYATNLSEFATLIVHPIGSWAEYDAGTISHEPYLSVVAFGNNGEKYGRRYRFVEPGETTEIEFDDQDMSIDRLPSELQERLDETVRRALEEDGYTVR